MKKIIPILILCIFLLIGFSQTSHAIELLIKNYPNIGGESITDQSGIPGLIKYIYLFSLGIVGFVALLSIVIGAFQYTTSAGNPTSAGEAKDRIVSALLGVLILLSAFLILNTINPDLVNFELKLPKYEATKQENNTLYYQCSAHGTPLCGNKIAYSDCFEFPANDQATINICLDHSYCKVWFADDVGGGNGRCHLYQNQSECKPKGCN